LQAANSPSRKDSRPRNYGQTSMEMGSKMNQESTHGKILEIWKAINIHNLETRSLQKSELAFKLLISPVTT